MTSMLNTTRLVSLPICLAAMLLCGCGSSMLSGRTQALDRNASRPYPIEMEKQPSLPIHVQRNVTKISMTNTSARAFGASTIWLNGRYSREIEGFAVGQTLTLPLGEFTDEFGQHFRGGGFFATENPDPMVMAEIETEGEIIGLVVVGDFYE